VSVQEQTNLWERQIEDEALESALEARQKLRDQRKDLNRRIRDAEGAARTQIDALELGEGAVVRVGRFLVSVKRTEAKEVQFTRGGDLKTQISLLPE